MSVLLNDENLCATNFCRMLYRRETNEWRFSAVVSDVIESRSTLGHTDYRLLITAIPRNGIEIETRNFTLLTRFKELYRLWSQLTKIHQQLYLHGTFPDFAPQRLFKRSEPDTIIERVEGTKRVLNFVFDSDVLCKSRVVQQFFEAAIEMEIDRDRTEPIATTNSASTTATNTFEIGSETPPSELLEEVSLQSPEPAIASADEEVGFFEFSAVTTNPFNLNTTTANPSVLERMFPRFTSHEQAGTLHYSIQNRGDISSADALRISSRTSSVSSVGSPANNIIDSDYLVQAAHFIATAQRAETEQAYELAFHCFKNAITILLQGVQMENDMSKRSAVRKKIVKYLMKAERIGRTHLSFDGTTFDMDSWLNISLQDPSLVVLQASTNALKCFKFVSVLPDLSSPKRVLLVEDADGEKFVMKFLEKKACSSKSADQKASTSMKMNVIPVGISFAHMVAMHKFFETDNFIILLLEYVEGGRLWNFLSKFFGSCTEDLEHQKYLETNFTEEDNADDIPSTSSVQGQRTVHEANAYSGRRVSFSVGYDPSEHGDADHFDAVLRHHAHARDSIDSVEGGSFCAVGVDAAASLAAGFSPTFSPKFHRLIPISEGPSSEVELPFRTVLSNSTLHANVEQFSVDDTPIEGIPSGVAERVELDEEAPAKINLGTGPSMRRRTLSQKDGTEMTLEDALSYCKSKLAIGHKWSKSKALPEQLVVHWMAQLVSAVHMLHSHNVVIRDLRPDNLLIDMDANLKLTYCSQWSNVEQKINRNAKESRYYAPEIGAVNELITDAADRYSLALILYEMLCGIPFSCPPHGPPNYAVCELILPQTADISFAAHDLLTRLLIKNPSERLSDDDLRAHPFFSSCDWGQYDRATANVKQSDAQVNNFTNPPDSNNLVIGHHSPKAKNTSPNAVTNKSAASTRDIAKNISEPLNPVSLVELT